MTTTTVKKPHVRRVFVALLRGVNVGGTSMLAMKDLAALCTRAGFASVRTYIQSGNVLFESALPRARVLAVLERDLADHMGKKVDVVLRDAAELRGVLARNPFPDAEPAKVAVGFCSVPLEKAITKKVVAPGGERVIVDALEFYTFYPDGMGRSKLKFPKIDGVVTVRNINTVTKLVTIADAMIVAP